MLRTDPGIVQVGPHRFGEIHPGQSMLHQPAAQFFIAGHALHKLVSIQAGGDSQDIIQTVDAFRTKCSGENILRLHIHGVHQLRQTVQLLDASFTKKVITLDVTCKDFRGALASYNVRRVITAEFLQPEHGVSDLVRVRGKADMLHLRIETAFGHMKYHYAIPPISWRCSAGSSFISSSSVRLPW